MEGSIFGSKSHRFIFQFAMVEDKLHIVAELMDLFTRQENNAYVEEMQRVRMALREAQMHNDLLARQVAQTRREVRELQRQVDTQIELNDHQQERTFQLEQYIILQEQRNRSVRRRLVYDSDETETDME